MKDFEQRFFQLLGLAQRAGKVVSGHDLVINEIRRGKARLVLISQDAATATKQKVKTKGSYYNIKVVEIGNRETLGHAIGKEQRVVLAVTDEGFANKLLIILGNNVGVNK